MSSSECNIANLDRMKFRPVRLYSGLVGFGLNI